MDEVNKHPSLFEKKKSEEVKIPVVEKKEVVEVDDKPMCELENHSWRDSWLKTAVSSKHVIFCVICGRTKFNEDGSVQDWLLKQGYVRPKDKSDDYVNDVYKFKGEEKITRKTL